MRASARLLLLLVLSLHAGLSIPGYADDDDHDRARAVRNSGQILPLQAILSAVERDFRGEVLEVELEGEDDDAAGAWIYEIKVLTAVGSVIELKYDAATGRLLGARGHELERARRRQENDRD